MTNLIYEIDQNSYSGLFPNCYLSLINSIMRSLLKESEAVATFKKKKGNLDLKTEDSDTSRLKFWREIVVLQNCLDSKFQNI